MVGQQCNESQAEADQAVLIDLSRCSARRYAKISGQQLHADSLKHEARSFVAEKLTWRLDKHLKGDIEAIFGRIMKSPVVSLTQFLLRVIVSI